MWSVLWASTRGCNLLYCLMVLTSSALFPILSESFLISTSTTRITTRHIQRKQRIQHQANFFVIFNQYSFGHCDAITELSTKQDSTTDQEKEATKTKRRTWEESYQLLVSYKERHGNCNVPDKYKQNPRLGNWVLYQRRRKISLSDERIVKLNDLGFLWSNERNEERWDKMFEKLVQYAKKNNGDCNVPKNNDDDINKELYLWVEKQRLRKSLLSEERFFKLDQLGLIWDDANKVKADQKWNEKYEHLQEYKQKYGHCRVPYNWKENPPLGNWVRRQRNNYKKGLLRKDRHSKLEEIDFTWNVRTVKKPNYIELDLKWLIKFGILHTFVEEHGHFSVPALYEKDRSLGIWVRDQRKNQKNGILRADRKELLDDIHFPWSFDDQKDKQWREKYKELKRFKEINGHLRLPRNSSLASWGARQRVFFAAGRMNLKRKALLDDIDFRWEIKNSSSS